MGKGSGAGPYRVRTGVVTAEALRLRIKANDHLAREASPEAPVQPAAGVDAGRAALVDDFAVGL